MDRHKLFVDATKNDFHDVLEWVSGAVESGHAEDSSTIIDGDLRRLLGDVVDFQVSGPKDGLSGVCNKKVLHSFTEDQTKLERSGRVVVFHVVALKLFTYRA